MRRLLTAEGSNTEDDTIPIGCEGKDDRTGWYDRAGTGDGRAFSLAFFRLRFLKHANMVYFNLEQCDKGQVATFKVAVKVCSPSARRVKVE